MLVERYWEDTLASRVTLVSDQCEVGDCIVPLLYCPTSADEKLHKMRKMCNFSFQPENYNNLLRKLLLRRKIGCPYICPPIVPAIVQTLIICITVIYANNGQWDNNIYKIL